MAIQELGSGNHAGAKYFIYRADDPKEYGHICPRCFARYGDKQRRGEIDVTRCKPCDAEETLTQWEDQRFYKASQYQRKKMAMRLLEGEGCNLLSGSTANSLV